jgi:hypothetical protein
MEGLEVERGGGGGPPIIFVLSGWGLLPPRMLGSRAGHLQSRWIGPAMPLMEMPLVYQLVESTASPLRSAHLGELLNKSLAKLLDGAHCVCIP